VIAPAFVYWLTCYVRGYRMKKRHYLGALTCVVLLLAIVSPVEIYARPMMTNLSFQERMTKGYQLLSSLPKWDAIWQAQLDVEAGTPFDQYYSRRGTFVLSRLSLIRADSDLIAACANGYHYGFKALKIDLLHNIPRILYRNKPNETSGLFVEGIVGQADQSDKPNSWNFTAISDSFGAFGWLGVAVFPMLVLPWVFVVYDSMFDISRPWGTMALGLGALTIWGANIIALLNIMTKDPIALWFLAFLTVGIARVLTGRSRFSPRAKGGRLGDYPPAKLIS
jgi:hypothetical protein